jgi:uncharacterized protein (DUF488 family)
MFISLLRNYNINGVIDVRSNPNSKFHEEFNKKNIESELKIRSIIYRNYQDEFGARQLNTAFYSDGYLNFRTFSNSKIFMSGISKVIAGTNAGYTIVLMCAEKDPVNCHRNIMVARKLHEMGYEIRNLLSDGTYELQTDLEMRLVDKYFPDRNQMSLLSEQLSIGEMIDTCYEIRNREIGYRKSDDEEYI